MRPHPRIRPRIICWVCLLVVPFVLGRYSAYGAAQLIPLTNDQLLVGLGMVKVTMETARSSQNRMLAIAEDQMRGRYTRTEASAMMKRAIDEQETLVGAALAPFLSRNATVSKKFTVEPGQLPEDILNTIEYVQTKFPGLFSRYLN